MQKRLGMAESGFLIFIGDAGYLPYYTIKEPYHDERWKLKIVITNCNIVCSEY